MNRSNRSLGLPPEGSKVRLVGLRNPELNEKIGTITGYSRDGDRVMLTLADGPQGLVKVKPKQIEVIEEDSSGGRLGLHRRNNVRSSSRAPRSASRDSRIDGAANPRNGRIIRGGGLGQSHASNFNQGNLRRVGSTNSFRENASRSSNGVQQEIMETLRSADAMFDLADTSGDGLISQEEFEYYMSKHTNHDQKMIRECFLSIDVDGNGDITRDEVRNAFLKKRREVQGGEVSESAKTFEEELVAVSKDADALFDKADVNRNGALDIREFEIYMKRNTSHSDAAIKELFHQMDSDKDGFITRAEVRKVYIKKKKEEGDKKSLMDILGLDDDDMADIEDDVYNMFFLSDFGSASFWFAILAFGLKLTLIIIIGVDLFTNRYFPNSVDVPKMVWATQVLLIPVNASVQEELIATFYIYANLKWSKHILELNPGASKAKFHVANLMRFMDGLAFLTINTTLLLQAEDILSSFLNFAALQFLSSIDNVALHLARDGYLTEELEAVAGDVLLMKLPKNHDEKLQVLDSVLICVVILVQLVAWIMKHFVYSDCIHCVCGVNFFCDEKRVTQLCCP